MRQDVREVEDVDLVRLPELDGLLLGADLDGDGPGREVALLDGHEQVLDRVVRRALGGLVGGQEVLLLVTDVREHVPLSVDPLALLVDELDGVAEV